MQEYNTIATNLIFIFISSDLKNYIPYKTSKVYTILEKPINYDDTRRLTPKYLIELIVIYLKHSNN